MNRARLPRLLGTALLVVAVLHLGFGRTGAGMTELFDWLASQIGLTAGPDDIDVFVLKNIRAPRMLVAAFGGAALAWSRTRCKMSRQ